MKIKCPYCAKPTHYDLNNPYRPFCSERCKLLDLGAWADENYKIPTNQYEEINIEEDPYDEDPS